MYRYWVNLHTLLSSHSFWKIKRCINVKNRYFKSLIQLLAQKCASTDFSNLEKIHPFCLPLWKKGVETYILPDRDIAIKLANSQRIANRAIFTDGSARNGLVGIGISSSFLTCSRIISSQENLNTYFAELAAIDETIKAIDNICTPHFIILVC